MQRPIAYALFLSLLLTACGKKPGPTPPSPPGPAPSADLTPSRRLRKLSFHLEGSAPSDQDYQQLAAAAGSGGLEAFFAQKTREYLATPAYAGKMLDRLDELFRLRGAAGLPEARLVAGATEPDYSLPGSETLDAMDLLFEDIVRNNLSWDKLLTATGYRFPGSIGTGTSGAVFFEGAGGDIGFLQPVVPELASLPPQDNKYVSASFPENDPRIAGAVTTARFFGRYGTTNTNRSRGRAAALFRTFLCDDMRAVVEAKSQDDESDLLKKAFPPPAPDGWHTRKALSAWEARGGWDAHGTQPSCIACHYKLDPMGRSFFTIGSVLSDRPSPGALVYKRGDGSLVQIRGRGLGDLGRAIIQQPEYAACQVSHFWRWFIRSDEMPSEARKDELVAEFNRLGRRPNDFVTYLVNQKEFYASPSEKPQVTLLQVKDFLQRCDACHSGLGPQLNIPSFVSLPLGGDRSSEISWVKRIVEQLDLAHDGANRSMPPPEAAWQPAPEELKTVRAWIEEGVRDEAGRQTIDPAAVAPLLEPEAQKGSAPRKTFRSTLQRYVSGHDVFRLWKQKFPQATLDPASDCFQFSDQNRALLGEKNPATGEPTYTGPSAAFVRWYTKCLVQVARADTEASYKDSMARYFGSEQGAVADAKAVKWGTLSDGVRSKILLHLVTTYLGPGILPDEAGFVRKIGRNVAEKLSDKSVFEALNKILFLIGTQDEFLSY